MGSTWNQYFLFLLFKRVKIFLHLLCNCLNISYASVGQKNYIGYAISTLISITLALLHNVTKLASAATFKQNNFFFQIYFKNVNLFIVSYFELNFIEKFL